MCDVGPAEKALEVPGDEDDDVAAIGAMMANDSSHSSEDYASVQDASSLGGHPSSLPV